MASAEQVGSSQAEDRAEAVLLTQPTDLHLKLTASDPCEHTVGIKQKL